MSDPNPDEPLSELEEQFQRLWDLLEKQWYELGELEARKLCNSYPDEYECWQHLARMLQNRCRFKEAIEAYRRSTECPNFDYACINHRDIGDCFYSLGDFTSAEREYRFAVKDSYDIDYLGPLIDLLKFLGRKSEAYRLLDVVIQQSVSIGRDLLWYELGSLYMEDDQFVEAKEAFDNALRTNPDNEDAKNQLEHLEAINKYRGR